MDLFCSRFASIVLLIRGEHPLLARLADAMGDTGFGQVLLPRLHQGVIDRIGPASPEFIAPTPGALDDQFVVSSSHVRPFQ